MRTSDDGARRIRGVESFRGKAYRKFAGEPWTIGYGTTMINGKPVTEGMICTEPEALVWFKIDLLKFEKVVDTTFPGIVFTQGQYDALVSFCYNNGSFKFASSLVRAIKLDPNNEPRIREAFLLYVKIKADKDNIDNDGDGLIDEPGEMRKIEGLVNRRNHEIDMYFGIHK